MIYITHFRAKNVCHRILSIQAHVLENADVALEFEYRAYNYANFTLPVIYWDSYGGRKKTRRRRISWFGLHINGNFITIFSFITCCSMMDVYRAFFSFDFYFQFYTRVYESWFSSFDPHRPFYNDGWRNYYLEIIVCSESRWEWNRI